MSSTYAKEPGEMINRCLGEGRPISKNRKCVKDGARFTVQVYNLFQQDEYVEIKKILEAESVAGCLIMIIESKEGKFYQGSVRIYESDLGFLFIGFKRTEYPKAKIKPIPSHLVHLITNR